MAIASKGDSLGRSFKDATTSMLPRAQLPAFPEVSIGIMRSSQPIQITVKENGEESLEAIVAVADDPQLADLSYNLTIRSDVFMAVEILLPEHPTATALAVAATVYRQLHAIPGIRKRLLMGVHKRAANEAHGSATQCPTRAASRLSTPPPLLAQIPPQFIPNDTAAPGQTLQLFLSWLLWTNRFNIRELRHVSQNFHRKELRVQDIARMKPWKWCQINVSRAFGSQVSESAEHYVSHVTEVLGEVLTWHGR